jgi:hypothetical protein
LGLVTLLGLQGVILGVSSVVMVIRVASVIGASVVGVIRSYLRVSSVIRGIRAIRGTLVALLGYEGLTWGQALWETFRIIRVFNLGLVALAYWGCLKAQVIRYCNRCKMGSTPIISSDDCNTAANPKISFM